MEKSEQLIITALKYWGTNPKNWGFAWCAAFSNFILEENGIKGTGSYMARSNLKLGKSTSKPKLGDMVVLWRVDRESPWGHNGFYITEDSYWVTLLGGNQDATVKIKRYPKWQILDIRDLTT